MSFPEEQDPLDECVVEVLKERIRELKAERDLLRALILDLMSSCEVCQKNALQTLRRLSEAWEKTS